MACPLDFYCHGSAQQMNGRGRRNDAGSSLADSVQRVRQNQMTVLWSWGKNLGRGNQFTGDETSLPRTKHSYLSI